MKMICAMLGILVLLFSLASCGGSGGGGGGSQAPSGTGTDPSVIAADWTLCTGHITPRIGFQGDINFTHDTGTYSSGTVTYTGWFGGPWFSSGLVYVLNDYGSYSGTYSVSGDNIHLTIVVPGKGTDSVDYSWGYYPVPPPILLYMSSSDTEVLQCVR